MLQQKSRRDVLAGLVFIVFGAAFAYASYGYDLGEMRRIGPGLFPLILAVVLIGLGALVIAKGAIESGDTALGPIPWRGILLICAALAFFGLTVRGLGLGPALFVTTVLSALSSRENGPVFAVVFGVLLTAFCYLIFVRGLGMTAPMLGPWIS